jgi:hypothetical protein
MSASDRLFNLLPLAHRERDAAEGFPLRALLRIIGEQAGHVEQDIRGLYEDLFIETCRPWVIPYIGDLVSNRLLFDASRTRGADVAAALFQDLAGKDLRPPIAIRTRADVAKTIYFRRRKGTLPMLEELARDVTGWPAHAVEFFELLGWTQFREHIRFASRWADVRNVDRMDRIGRAFDETSHTVDVRRPGQREGWHNVPNIGFFLYRLGSYALSRVPAREGGQPWQYHFSPLGHKAPLFSRWRREGNEAGLATALHVPAPIRPPFFYEDLERYRNLPAPPARPDFTSLYGLPDPLPPLTTVVCPECSFFILRNGNPVLPAQDPLAPPALFEPQIVCRRLDPWPAAQPSGRFIAVDVAAGRMAIGDGFGDATEVIDVYYHYGFSADMGGGPYDRRKWLVRPEPGVLRLFVREGIAPGSEPNTFPTLADALTEWSQTLDRPDAVITILDSRAYLLPAQISLRNEGFLVIEAANGERPLLRSRTAGLALAVSPPAIPGDTDNRAAFTLNGVVLEGHLQVTGDLARLRLLHATLVPGRRLDEEGEPVSSGASIVIAAGTAATPINDQLRVEIAFSILGSIEAPAHAAGVWLLDSIIDALADTAPALSDGTGAAGPALFVERSTIFGGLLVRSLEMSESIATGHIDTVRTQHGCVRFSYVLPASRTPRRFRCQPDLAGVNIVPSFSALRYGQPAYAQLRLGSPIEIRTGAEDGSEMGAFSHLKQPQRESNLRLRLEEYLPFGLEPAVVYET